MNDDEMKNFDLFEALMKRSSNVETKDEAETLDRLIQEGKIHTPTPDCFLDGITRRTVIGIAKKHGYEVIERAIMPEELADTSEIFVTGTAAEVTPVGEIDDHKFKVGTITRTLLEDYDALVRGKLSEVAA